MDEGEREERNDYGVDCVTNTGHGRSLPGERRFYRRFAFEEIANR
jgi:hypothetical protein